MIAADHSLTHSLIHSLAEITRTRLNSLLASFLWPVRGRPWDSEDRGPAPIAHKFIESDAAAWARFGRLVGVIRTSFLDLPYCSRYKYYLDLDHFLDGLGADAD